jgi:hypothetical protein
MEKFQQHRADLQEYLSVYTHINLQSINTQLKSIALSLEDFKQFLSSPGMQSPGERNLLDFIEKNGGPQSVWKDESLLKELIERSGIDKELEDRDYTESSSAQAKLVAKVKAEAQKELNNILDESKKSFNMKWQAMESQFTRMEGVVKREGDRVINKMQEGPHNRIVDQVNILSILRDFV